MSKQETTTTIVTVYNCKNCFKKATIKGLHRSLFNCPDCSWVMDRKYISVQ